MIIDISVVFTAYGITALMQGFSFSYLKNLFRNQTLHTSRIWLVGSSLSDCIVAEGICICPSLTL